MLSSLFFTLILISERFIARSDVEFSEGVKAAEQVHDAECTVIQSVAGSAFLTPDMSSVVRADIAGEAAVMVCLYDIEYSDITVAVAVRCLGEITVRKMLYISYMCKGNSAAVFSYYVSYIVCRVRAKRAGAERQAVVRVVHHLQKAVDGRLIY